MENRRVDQKLSKEFRKDATFEDILSSLNNCLAREEENIFQEQGDIYPTLHILGAPRSGTTFVSQLILSYLPVGYINNLIATFWKAPIYGIELSEKLLGKEYKSDFKSVFGRTAAIREPHEFGYFWGYHLHYNDLQQKDSKHEMVIDWSHLAKVINNMTYHFDAPIVFKSFLLGFHAAKMVEKMSKTCFVYVKRNFLDNAFSILKLRKQLNGDENEWGSIKPKQYEMLKDLSVYEQIAGQILCMEHEYLCQLENVPKKNKAIFKYEDICSDPRNFLLKTGCLLSNHYLSEELTIPEIPSFNISRSATPDKTETELFLKAKNRIKQLFPYIKEYNLDH